MSILDRYLLRELFKVLLGVLLVVSLIMSSLGFVRLLENAALGDLNPDAVLPLMGYQILHYLARTVPAALFLSILAVLGRMYRDNEMTALAACGFGTARIYRAFGYALLPVAGLTLWLAVWVQPWAAGRMEEVVAAQRQRAAELAGLQPGRFNEFSEGELVFYVERIDREQEQMHNIFVQDRQHGKLGLVVAERGRHMLDPVTGDHLLILEQGRRFEGLPGAGQFTAAAFQRYTLRVAEGASAARDRRSAKPSGALLQSDDVRDQAELWERFSYPFSLITLTLIAIPLSRSLPRQGLYGRLFLAFLVYFAFLNLHAVSVSWMKKGITPAWLGIWWVQAVLLLLAITALTLDSRGARRLSRRWRDWRANRIPAAGAAP
jgi:lipopolysaccharide export system permease protein